MNRPVVDIILPCYNPQNGWTDTVVNSYQKIEQDSKNWIPRLMIVNDGSTSGIDQKDIQYLKSRIESLNWISYAKNKGKGYALRQGVLQSDGDYIILTDIDFPYTHQSIMTMVESLISNPTDVLAGERNEDYYAYTPYSRKLISKFLKMVVRDLLRIKVSDTQCGLKGMRREVKNIFLNTTIDRYLFDLEFLWLAGKQFSIKPFPVKLKENIVFSNMNSKILMREAINFVKFYLKTFGNNEK